MTTSTLTSPARVRAGAPARPGVTPLRVLTSEWIKFRTLRSTAWTLAGAVLAMTAIAVMLALVSTSVPEAAETSGMSNLVVLTGGVQVAQLALVVLGVLLITGEYSTGMVRSTFAAVPSRLPVLGAKAVVTAIAAAVVTVLGLALAWVATLPFDGVAPLDLGDAGTVRVLGGTVLYLATLTLLALTVGALVRHSAGAIAIVMGLLLVVEPVLYIVPNRITATIGAFLPSTAGSRIMTDPDMLEATRGMNDAPFLTAWQGYGVLLAWVVVLGTLAAVLLRRRDA
ncbi:ABC transporter permease subunit [Cellulomonas oligotrophica]|uniref:ABC transporter permease n=1 Tax=Cellulomonas oligotrophica TaxID=931536 RepID=A0A7Y9FIA4_9CELL|nr:ABC transporter permease subunit [Cellulomonas oligotrophica]NYD87866.1 ABC-2 type transport system permease protein [Cellulomonas oligotrophica]GIG32927.1 ABC transporter permease [Cellulomonas oligotrophica]